MVSSWDEDRKFILRGWSLVFSVLATLMVLSVVDGRLVYLQGSYTGYLGIWTDCRRYKCASLGQVTVLIHMSMGFMMLALILCLILLPTMGLSFRPVFRRLIKIDLVFSFLSFSIGFLIVLSLTLFVVNCETLHPRPQVTYLVTTYLCWTAGALMLSAELAPCPWSSPRGPRGGKGPEVKKSSEIRSGDSDTGYRFGKMATWNQPFKVAELSRQTVTDITWMGHSIRMTHSLGSRVWITQPDADMATQGHGQT